MDIGNNFFNENQFYVRAQSTISLVTTSVQIGSLNRKLWARKFIVLLRISQKLNLNLTSHNDLSFRFRIMFILKSPSNREHIVHKLHILYRKVVDVLTYENIESFFFKSFNNNKFLWKNLKSPQNCTIPPAQIFLMLIIFD